jgi:hypothetical protein
MDENRRMLCTRVVSPFMAVLAPGVLQGAPQTATVSTTARWNGVDSIGAFGRRPDATYHQSFTPRSGRAHSVFLRVFPG